MEQESQKMEIEESVVGQTPNGPILCANNCGFFGSVSTNNFCSKCYRDFYLKQSNNKASSTAIVTNVVVVEEEKKKKKKKSNEPIVELVNQVGVGVGVEGESEEGTTSEELKNSFKGPVLSLVQGSL